MPDVIICLSPKKTATDLRAIANRYWTDEEKRMNPDTLKSIFIKRPYSKFAVIKTLEQIQENFHTNVIDIETMSGVKDVEALKGLHDFIANKILVDENFILNLDDILHPVEPKHTIYNVCAKDAQRNISRVMHGYPPKYVR